MQVVRRGRARTRTRLQQVRDATPSLVKMFCTCLATVCSLITNTTAISRLLFPVATSRSTSSSRGLKPCIPSPSSPLVSKSTDATDGAAPSCSKSLPRRVQLEDESIFVAECTTCSPHEHTCERYLVGSLELLPGLDRMPKADQRASRIACSELERARRPA